MLYAFCTFCEQPEHLVPLQHQAVWTKWEIKMLIQIIGTVGLSRADTTLSPCVQDSYAVNALS